jgi:CDP-glucose 4,6-dehydratase
MERSSTFWRGRNVLVTGCTGVVGSWLTEALAEAGADVVGLIRDWVPQSHLVRSGTIDRIRVVRGEVEDYQLVHRVLNEYEVDTVFHLAALTIVTIANRAPLSTFETNIQGSWTVFEAARHAPLVTRVVLASSDKAYGTHPRLPYTEEMPLLARHPYDVSKACAELLARSYHTTYGLPVGITRCANIYGGGDLNFNRVVPGAIRAALLGERPVIRSDGSPLRDYLYVRDAVSAYLTLAEALDDPAVHGEAFNFGIDNPKSVLEMTQLILSLSEHPELQPIIEGRELKEIQDQYLSSDKARAVLGWQPRFSLVEGLRETMAWYRAYLQSEGPPA